MTHPRIGVLRRRGPARVATLALAVTAFSPAVSEGKPTQNQLMDCPTFQSPPPPPGAPPVLFATSVAKSDTSTSRVITADGPEIRCGRTEVATYSDIVYSTPRTSLALKMDVLVPEKGRKKPLVVYFSGGGFIRSTKEAALDHRTYVAEAGYVVASIQYRTIATGSTYRDGVADAKSAIRYLRAHAHEYGIDPRRVAVWGESAGGYMAAMVGATNRVDGFDVGENLDQSSAVQAVIDQFGASDLARTAADFDATFQNVWSSPGSPIAQWVHGPGTTKSITDDPSAVARANPATYVTRSDPAFLLFHGDNDRLVSPSQTLLVHNALRARGVDSTRYVLRGANHGDLSFVGDTESGIPWSTEKVMGLMTKFLGKHLKR